MSSDKINKWVEKNPESWASLAENTNKKESFDTFKKKLKAGARTQGKFKAIQNMTNAQINTIYQASGLSTKKTKTKIDFKEPAFKTKKTIIKRNNKTYSRTITNRWATHTTLGLKLASKLKPRSKQYNQYVENIMASTGRSRQAVIKKIQRTRKSR